MGKQDVDTYETEETALFYQIKSLNIHQSTLNSHFGKNIFKLFFNYFYSAIVPLILAGWGRECFEEKTGEERLNTLTQNSMSLIFKAAPMGLVISQGKAKGDLNYGLVVLCLVWPLNQGKVGSNPRTL